jgi:hypothetical protein
MLKFKIKPRNYVVLFGSKLSNDVYLSHQTISNNILILNYEIFNQTNQRKRKSLPNYR